MTGATGPTAAGYASACLRSPHAITVRTPAPIARTTVETHKPQLTREAPGACRGMASIISVGARGGKVASCVCPVKPSLEVGGLPPASPSARWLSASRLPLRDCDERDATDHRGQAPADALTPGIGRAGPRKSMEDDGRESVDGRPQPSTPCREPPPAHPHRGEQAHEHEREGHGGHI